jgi:hypothetical protein
MTLCLFLHARNLLARARLNKMGQAGDLPKDEVPRFFHSLEHSLFGQLQERVATTARTRNLLLCGSGFFESSVSDEAGPQVLKEIARLAHLKPTARKVLIAPPETSGQLREWAQRTDSSGWERPLHATDPRRRERRLHAKFILTGRASGEGQDLRVDGAHLYLGSGNLSLRGMTASGRKDGGNIECGVFFALDERLDVKAFEARLFWSPEAAPIEDGEWKVLPAGDDCLPPVVCCPILHALVSDDGAVELVWAEEAQGEVILVLDEHHPVRVTPTGAHASLRVSVIPATFTVRSMDQSREWQIAVVDEHERYAWHREPLRSVEDLLTAVSCFHRDEDAFAEADDEEEEGGPVATKMTTRAALPARRYPLMEMASFLEGLARAQQRLEGEDVDAWIEHLERLRDRPLDPGVLAGWRGTAVDLVTHLLHPTFAPPILQAKARERYRETLDSLVRRWELK